jgi:iron complex outermembrane receptor protein
VEVRAGIHSYVDKPFSIDLCTVNKPDLAAAVFAQHEITLAKKWDLTLGVRGDFSKLYGNFASSRFGLVYRPFSSTAWKLIFGRSFRHPSAYEMFYSAPPMVANPNARAENSTSVEVVAEQRLAPGIELSVTAYRNMVPNLLAATYTANGSVQYQNLANQLAIGIETGVKAVVRGIEMRADVALQRAIQDDVRNVLANSPGQVAHFQASIPIARQALRISPGLRFLGERRTMANAIVSGSHVADVTLSSPRPFHGVEIQAGVRNLLDRQYRDPVALTPAVDTLLAKGRTFFVTLTWGTRGP